MTPAFRAFVETRFRDHMNAQYPTLPLEYSNTDVPETVAEFAVIHIMASDDTVPICIGGASMNRNVGIIQVDVYTPKDQGTGEGREIAHFAGKVFKRKDFSVGVEGKATFKEHTVLDRGEVWGRHKEEMRVPYWYDFNHDA